MSEKRPALLIERWLAIAEIGAEKPFGCSLALSDPGQPVIGPCGLTGSGMVGSG